MSYIVKTMNSLSFKIQKQLHLFSLVFIVLLQTAHRPSITAAANAVLIKLEGTLDLTLTTAEDSEVDNGCFPCESFKNEKTAMVEFVCTNNISFGRQNSNPENITSRLLCHVRFAYRCHISTLTLTSLLSTFNQKRRLYFCKGVLLPDCPLDKKVLLHVVTISADSSQHHFESQSLDVEDVTCNQSYASSSPATTTELMSQDRINRRSVPRKVQKNPGSISVRKKRFGNQPTSKRVSSLNCRVHLIADHSFYSIIGRSDTVRSAQEMLSAIRFADNIFRSTDFDGDKSGDNVGFIVTKVTVVQTLESSKLKYSPIVRSAKEYLDSVSKNNFDDYCLAVIFTYTNFSLGIRGISYKAKIHPDDVKSGICSGFQPGRSDNEFQSLNAVVVSYSNVKPSSRRNVYIALAHELGHSFGSGHDDDTLCSASSTGRQFLMHSNNIKGDDTSNFRFSSCSVQQMKLVLENRAECLAVSSGPVCGNTVVEEGEACDCGWQDICDFVDKCCTPADKNLSGSDTPCMPRATEGAQCSHASSACCATDCTIPPVEGKICRVETECLYAAYCGGSGSECPASAPKPDGTPCSGGTRLCRKGVCAVSLCEHCGLKDCQCREHDVDFCKLCCKWNDTSECLPVHDFHIFRRENQTLYLNPGQSCGDKGTCLPDGTCYFGGFTAADLAEYKNDFLFGAWLIRYWRPILVCLVATVLLWLLFLLTRHHYAARRKPDVLIQLNALFISADVEKQKCENELEVTNKLCQERIQKIQNGNIRSDFVNAVTELRTLFPSVPLATVIYIVGISSDEETAVRLLLTLGFPMATSTITHMRIPRNY